jgi:hypothetical protein
MYLDDIAEEGAFRPPRQQAREIGLAKVRKSSPSSARMIRKP